jgi:hypothetical protein
MRGRGERRERGERRRRGAMHRTEKVGERIRRGGEEDGETGTDKGGERIRSGLKEVEE